MAAPQLQEWPTGKVGRTSVVDLLPDEVKDQLVKARRNGTHSVRAMSEWLAHLGHEVSVNALSNWFSSRGHRHGCDL